MRWFSSLSPKSLAHAWLDIGKGCQWSFPTTPSTIWCTSSHAFWGTLPIPQCTNVLIHCPQYTLPCWGKDWKIVEVMISFRYEGSCSASSLGKWIIRWVKNFFSHTFSSWGKLCRMQRLISNMSNRTCGHAWDSAVGTGMWRCSITSSLVGIFNRAECIFNFCTSPHIASGQTIKKPTYFNVSKWLIPLLQVAMHEYSSDNISWSPLILDLYLNMRWDV
jgi:hypothetical protein